MIRYFVVHNITHETAPGTAEEGYDNPNDAESALHYCSDEYHIVATVGEPAPAIDRPCQCGGTYALHHPLCPLYPEFGYDDNGVPHTESQIGKAFEKIGEKMADKVNAAMLESLQLRSE